MTHPLRAAHDFYPTPPEATRALLSVEAFPGPVWEPAVGNGAITRVLTAYGHTVVGTDLVDRGFGTGGIDFLAESANRARDIVTNPPYALGLPESFIRHALHLANPVAGSVAMLIPLTRLANPLGIALWLTHPPAAVHILDELVCQPDGRPVITNPQLRFCWCVWRPSFTGPTTLGWLHTRRFRRPGDHPHKPGSRR